MALVLGDRVIENGLSALDTECDKIFVCSAQPTTYAEATTALGSGGFALGNKNFGSAGAAFTAPAAGSPSGRKTQSVPITDGSVTTSGTVSHWAAVASATSRLLASDVVSGGIAVTSGQTFTLASFAVQMGGATFTFTPADLPGLSLWLEAADASTLFQTITATTPATANGDPIGTWQDKSGDSFHITAPANDTTRPTLQGVGGFECVRFDGSNDILRRAAALLLFAGLKCSIFFAIKGNPAAGRYLFSECDDGASTDNIIYAMLSPAAAATSAGFFMRDESGTTFLNSADSVEPNCFDNTARVIGAVDSGSSLTFYNNGVVGDVESYNRVGHNMSTSNRFSIGALSRSTDTAFFAADIYGVVIVTGVNGIISAPDRAKLVTYLGNLAGLSL